MAKHLTNTLVIAKFIARQKNTKIKKETFRLFKKSKLNFISPKPCNKKEISNIIVSPNARKATGPNSIPNFVLKEFKEELKKPLSYNFFSSVIMIYTHT